MKTGFLAACMVVAGSLACGGGGSTSVNGNIRGSSLPVSDTLSANVNIKLSSSQSFQAGAIFISNMSNVCSNATAGKVSKNSRMLGFVVSDYSSSTQTTSAPTSAGAYPVVATTFSSSAPPPKFAFVSYGETDASCQNISGKTATGASGTINLTSVSGGNYAGTFDLTLDEGDHLTGSFNGSNCAGLQAAIDTNTAPTCI